MAVLSAVGTKVWLLYVMHYTMGRLSFNVVGEICSYLQDLLLYQVTPDFLRPFNCQTSAWGPKVPLSTQIQVDVYSRWVVLKDEGSLFCSGGGND